MASGTERQKKTALRLSAAVSVSAGKIVPATIVRGFMTISPSVQLAAGLRSIVGNRFASPWPTAVIRMGYPFPQGSLLHPRASRKPLIVLFASLVVGMPATVILSGDTDSNCPTPIHHRNPLSDRIIGEETSRLGELTAACPCFLYARA